MMAQQLKQHLYMSAGAVATVSESSARLGFGTESSAAVRLHLRRRHCRMAFGNLTWHSFADLEQQHEDSVLLISQA